MRPNRTDRRLHWRVELFKVTWGTFVLLAGGLIALSRGLTWSVPWSWEVWLMLGGIIAASILVVGAVALGVLVILTVRLLPDD
jgi:hypothetical protein